MELHSGLIQEQLTRLHISPQFMQAIHMLQMSSAELIGYVQAQVAENPFLEIGWDNYERGRSAATGNGSCNGSSSRSDLRDAWSAIPSQGETLERMLLSQLRIKGVHGKLLQLAQYLAGNMNGDGYLSVSLEEASAHLSAPLSDVEAALSVVQSLEPAGIGARSVQECLQIQIQRDDLAQPYAYPIAARYLKELAGGKLHEIAKGLGISVAQVQNAFAYIRTLDPRPGLPFATEPLQYAIPDAEIRLEQNRCVVVMNDFLLPRLFIQDEYVKLMAESRDKETAAYLRDRYHAAKRLQDGLGQRKSTLLKVLEAIAYVQLHFLQHGTSALKPMSLKTIAEKVSLHPSTISRAIQNKYVLTPYGIYGLKYLFTNALSTSEGAGVVSARSVKEQIRQMIDSENKANPLSDQQIAHQLNDEGVQISRRTVMKYREEMHILSSRLRSCRVRRRSP